jgi:hypothetical protein
MSKEMIHFCCLKAAKNEKGLRPVISKSIEELGITHEQAMEICLELTEHKTICAWLTGGSIIKEDKEGSE